MTNDPVNYTDPTGHVGEGITVDDGENPDVFPGGDSGTGTGGDSGSGGDSGTGDDGDGGSTGSGGTTVTIKDISNGNQAAIKASYGSISKTSFNTAKAVVGTPKGTTVVKASAPKLKTLMSSQKMETAIKEIKNGSAMAIKKSLPSAAPKVAHKEPAKAPSNAAMIKAFSKGVLSGIKESLSAMTQNPLLTVGMIALVAGASAIAPAAVTAVALYGTVVTACNAVKAFNTLVKNTQKGGSLHNAEAYGKAAGKILPDILMTISGVGVAKLGSKVASMASFMKVKPIKIVEDIKPLKNFKFNLKLFGESRKGGSSTFKSNEDAMKYYSNLVEKLNVKTGKNQAVFYSGPGNRQLAEQFAKENGKLTLEMTPGGKYLDNLKLFDSNSPLTGDQAAEIWGKLSKLYAKNASGTAFGFTQGSRTGSIFNTVEYPALVGNKNIVNVITEFFNK